MQAATRAQRLALTALIVGALIVFGLLDAASAGAGTYRAVQCSKGSGANRQDAHYAANSPRYVQNADCTGSGLGIRHIAGNRATRAGRFGGWTLTAPDEAEIVRLAARAKGTARGGHRPELIVGLGAGRTQSLPGIGRAFRTVTWAGTGGRFASARLRCARTSCGAGREAYLGIRRISLTLRDFVAPSLSVGGELLAKGSRRGVQALTIAADDDGSGVRELTVEVNGEPLAARALPCSLVGRVAVRLQPCPARPVRDFEIATRAPQFRQGPNNIRICAADYGARHNTNRDCESRTVRIDRLCPVSGIAGAVLHAHLAGGRERVQTTSTRSTIVAGSVLDDGGSPLPGARVCVATRTQATGHPERVIATPVTDANGRFQARIPAGPSREVRVAHWPDSRGALERYLAIEARAVPRLDLSPDRVLQNGDSVRFWVRIPGPSRMGRPVAVNARAGRRWIQVASGRTNRSGVWRGSYRFRATTGRQRYSFRAAVARQPGYPFAPGRSRTRRITVAG